MSGHIDETISQLQTLLKKQEEDVRGTKKTINSLLKLAGREPAFSDEELSSDSINIGSITPDRWYGQPLATAIRDYLSMRRASGQGAATVRQIFEALSSGGYQFEAANDDYAQRGLRSSMTKNTVFHKLPNNTFGLREWYPNAKSGRGSANESERDATEDSDSGESGEK